MRLGLKIIIQSRQLRCAMWGGLVDCLIKARRRSTCLELTLCFLAQANSAHFMSGHARRRSPVGHMRFASSEKSASRQQLSVEQKRLLNATVSKPGDTSSTSLAG